MKKIKKLLMIFASMLVIAIFFTGCGKKEDNDKESIMPVLGKENSDNLDITDIKQENTNFNIGDKVLFGNYEQDNNDSNGREPIMWEVLDVVDGKVLLSSYYVLDNIQYCEYAGIYGDDSIESLPWSSSYIFKWLNGYFANMAFSEDELGIIVDTTDYSAENQEIIGNVFLLSYNEILKYYNVDKITLTHFNGFDYDCSYSFELLCKPTPYAIKENVDYEELTQEHVDSLVEDGMNCDSYVTGNKYAGYWLRSSLDWDTDAWFTAEGHALYVEYDGTIEIGVAGFSNAKTKYHGVRPCVWINLEDAEEYLIIANDMEESWISEKEGEQYENNTEETDGETNDKVENELGWEIKDNTLYIFRNCKMKDWNPEAMGTYAPWHNEGNFTKVVIEEGIEYIGSYAFYQCEKLVEIEIAESVTGIGRNAFAECNSLENIYIPDNVKKIGYRMFEKCENLISVRMPKEAEIDSGLFEGCTSLTSVVLPENIDKIGGYMFNGCEALTSIDIPDSVTRIEDYAFNRCTSLTSIEIPNSVIYISEYAFVGCTAIE